MMFVGLTNLPAPAAVDRQECPACWAASIEQMQITPIRNDFLDSLKQI